MKYLLFPLLLMAACNKELKYSKEQLLKLAQEADSSVTYVLPRSMQDGINCQNYPEGCVSGHTVKVRGLEMIAVEFSTEAEAKYAALKVRGYYSRNWLFDDVKGEPLLEAFVEKHLNAKKP